MPKKNPTRHSAPAAACYVAAAPVNESKPRQPSGSGEGVAPRRMVDALSGLLRAAIKQLFPQEPPVGQRIELASLGGASGAASLNAEAQSLLARVFIQFAEGDATEKAVAKAALEQSGFNQQDNVEFAVSTALEMKHAAWLAALNQFIPGGLNSFQISVDGEPRNMAAFAVALDESDADAEAGERLQAVVGLGVDLWAVDASGNSALAQAVSQGQPRTVAWILSQAPDKKAAASLKTEKAASLAHLAVRSWSADASEALQLILAAGAPADEPDLNGRTPLIDAAATGDNRSLAILLDAGARIDAQDVEGATALIAATQQTGDAPAISMLLARGANANLANKEGDSALSIAIADENPDLVKILARATNPSLCDKAGETPIQKALSQGFWEGVDALVEHATDAEALAAVLAFARAKMPQAVLRIERAALLEAAAIGEKARDGSAASQAADSAESVSAGGGPSRRRPGRRV